MNAATSSAARQPPVSFDVDVVVVVVVVIVAFGTTSPLAGQQ